MKLTLAQLSHLEHVLWCHSNSAVVTIEDAKQSEAIRLLAQAEYKDQFQAENHAPRVSPNHVTQG